MQERNLKNNHFQIRETSSKHNGKKLHSVGGGLRSLTALLVCVGYLFTQYNRMHADYRMIHSGH